MSLRRRVTARLLGSDATTVITSLPDAFDMSCMDEANGFGTGSLSYPLASGEADELVRGRFVQFITNSTVRFTFRIPGNPRYVQKSPDGKHEEFLVASGRGWGEIFEDGIVDEDAPDLVDLDYGYKVWSCFSTDFPNAGGWAPAQELYEYRDLTEAGTRGRVTAVMDDSGTPDDTSDDVLYLYPAPKDFPWPNAPKNGNGFAPTPVYDETFWVIADGAAEDDVGYHFFIGTTELAGDQDVFFAPTADNWFTLYLDGVPILGEDADTLFWTGWKDQTLHLHAGLHTIGYVVQNFDAPELAFNPGGGLFNAIAVAVYPGDVDTSLTLSLLSSSAAGFPLSLFAADEFPGWTAGQIVPNFVSRAQARGELAQYAGDTFSDTLDSDGEAWDTLDPDTSTSYIPTFTEKIGNTGYDVLNDLNHQGWVDWHFQAATPTLDMWTAGNHGDDNSVDYHIPTNPLDITTGNLRSLERGETASYANQLKVQFATGYVWVSDAVEIAAFGTAVSDMYSTDARTKAEAERLGRVELIRRKQGARASIVVEIEPLSTSDCPWEGVNLLDYVSVPNEAGDDVDLLQVLSISMTTDGEGYARWRLELNARWRDPGREAIGLLRSIGGKSLGSASTRGVVST